MKEALLKKTKYLLSFKFSINEGNERYLHLLETCFYQFLNNIEEIYNHQDIASSTYYNMLLNKLNRNIKSIIIPADTFFYHPLGFLEFKTDLKDQLAPYKELGMEITKELKEEILKKNYFYYILQAIKNNQEQIGFAFKGPKTFPYLEKNLNEYQAITLARMNKFYKKEYPIIYPDGTKYHYFIYMKCFSCDEVLNMNAIAMIEAIFGREQLLHAEFDSNLEFLQSIDEEYDHLLGNLQYNKYHEKVYTTTTLLNEFLKRIEKAENAYKKLEYFKKLNRFLLEIFDYKITCVLNQKDANLIKCAIEEVKVLESNMLYNMNSSLHLQMEHVKILMRVKQKLSNYLNASRDQVEKKYTIYSLDKKKQDNVTSSVQPIHVDNKYVLIHILQVQSMNRKVLVKTNIHIVDYSSHATKIYGNLYLSLNELKHLFSSTDLGVFTKESEAIRLALANRVLNPTIMDIIKAERHNFLGEFVYSDEEERCIIYKNKSIEEVLG